MSPSIEEGSNLVFSVQEEWVGDAKLLTECTDGRRGLPDAHTYDCKSLGTELAVERFFGG